VPGTVSTYSRLPAGEEQVYIAVEHDDNSRTVITKKQLLVVDEHGRPTEEPIDHTEAYQHANELVVVEFLLAAKYNDPGFLSATFAEAADLFGMIGEAQGHMRQNSYRGLTRDQIPAEFFLTP
jgi:hypothetical protein